MDNMNPSRYDRSDNSMMLGIGVVVVVVIALLIMFSILSTANPTQTNPGAVSTVPGAVVTTIPGGNVDTGGNADTGGTTNDTGVNNDAGTGNTSGAAGSNPVPTAVPDTGY
jgi:hypothetical protein